MSDDHDFALFYACGNLAGGRLGLSKALPKILGFMGECQARCPGPGKHYSTKTGFSDSSCMELPIRQKSGTVKSERSLMLMLLSEYITPMARYRILVAVASQPLDCYIEHCGTWAIDL